MPLSLERRGRIQGALAWPSREPADLHRVCLMEPIGLPFFPLLFQHPKFLRNSPSSCRREQPSPPLPRCVRSETERIFFHVLFITSHDFDRTEKLFSAPPPLLNNVFPRAVKLSFFPSVLRNGRRSGASFSFPLT